jgi:hypothetical protein
MNLVFIKEESQGFRLRAKTFGCGDACLAIPLMPKAALAMLDAGWQDVRLPIELLAREEREAIRDEAIGLSKAWHNSLPPLECHGADLYDCCRLQMMGFFQDVLAAERIVPRLLEEYRPRSVLFLKRPFVPSYAHPMHDGTADVFEAVLQWRLSRAGVEVSVAVEAPAAVANRGPAFRAGLWTRLRWKLSALAAKRRSPGRVLDPPPWDPRRIPISDVPTNRPLVIGCGAGYDLLVMWHYLKAFAAEIGAYPLPINQEPALDARTPRSGLTLDMECRFLYMNDILEAGDPSPDIAQARDACLAALNGGSRLPDCLRNPYLAFQFEYFWDSLIPQAQRAACIAETFFRQFKVALYMDDYCAGPVNRAWVSVGDRVGVATATTPHGAVNLLEFHDFNARWALAWGELIRQNLQLAAPRKQDCVIVSGDPSMDRLRRAFPAVAADTRHTVLLLTGGFLHQVWTDMDLAGFLATWEEIGRLAAQRQSLRFLIKPHPSVRDLAPWYRQFVLRKGLVNVQVVDDQKLEALLPSAFLAVLVGKPGTAGLVSALADVPFVYLDTLLCRDVPGYGIWREGNGVPRLTHPSQLAELIDRFHADEAARNTLLEQNRRFAGLYCAPFQSAGVCRQMGLKG